MLLDAREHASRQQFASAISILALALVHPSMEYVIYSGSRGSADA